MIPPSESKTTRKQQFITSFQTALESLPPPRPPDALF